MSFEKIYGYEHIKKELNVVIDILNNKEKYQKTGAKLPAGILFDGEPGLGKTLFASEFINALTNRKVYTIRKNKPDGEFVNYITNTVNDAIKCAPSIVFFDDMDKFANDDERHMNSEEFVTIQALIDDARDKDVFFIATINYMDYIPRSLLRDGRFDYVYNLEAPKVEDASLIIKHFLENKNIADDVDFEEIAKLLIGKSIATLEKVMNDATIVTTYNNKEIIERKDIINAILRIVYDGPEAEEDEYAKNLAIYHEAGHALVSEVLCKGSVNLVSVKNYFSNTGGITSSNMPEKYWRDLDLMENRVKVLLAGKAATELFLNKTDTGVSSDLNRAQNIITRIIEVYAENNFNYWGVSTNARSTQMLTQFERDAVDKFETLYRETKRILIDHKDEYLKIVELLSNNEVITQREIKEIFA